MQKNNYYIKTNRIFNHVREYGWMATVLIAIGGLWVPKLGLAVLLVMAGLTITSFFSGRYWCGNVCFHGSLFDKIILPVSRNTKIPDFFKSKPFIIGFFIFFMANFTRRIITVSQYWGTYDIWDKLGALFSNTYLMVLIVGGALAILINPLCGRIVVTVP
jgi:ferredoxin-type protein NapH